MNPEKLSTLFDVYNTKANAVVENKQLDNAYMQAHNKLLEAIASSNATSVKMFLEYEIEKDFLLAPPWLRTLCWKLITLEMKDDLKILQRAYFDLSCFYTEHEVFLTDLKNQIAKLDQ